MDTKQYWVWEKMNHLLSAGKRVPAKATQTKLPADLAPLPSVELPARNETMANVTSDHGGHKSRWAGGTPRKKTYHQPTWTIPEITRGIPC